MSVGGVVLAALVLLLDPAALSAHPANVAYARIAIATHHVEIALSANLFELDLLLSLDANRDGRVDLDELQARRAEILDYLRRTVAVSASGADLPLLALPFALGQSRDGKPLFGVTLRFPSTTSIEDVVIRCEPFTELGADHATLATITGGGATKEFAFRQGVVYREAAGGWARALDFLRLGVLHIFIGFDHIAFLVGLLLLGGRLLTIIKIVTAFTVAHSVTLSLAALDVVTPNAAVVEAGIALSIVYIAVENLLRSGGDRRWLVSFAFGLVHGFGFAGVLKEMDLPRSGLVAALFSFNLGVEIGQLVIVLLVVPVLRLLPRLPAYHTVTRTASLFILSLGLFWLYQRVLG